MAEEGRPVFQVKGRARESSPVVDGYPEAAIVIDGGAGDGLFVSGEKGQHDTAPEGGVVAVIENHLAGQGDPLRLLEFLRAEAGRPRVAAGGEACHRVAELDSQRGELVDPGGRIGVGDDDAIALDFIGFVIPGRLPGQPGFSFIAAQA